MKEGGTEDVLKAFNPKVFEANDGPWQRTKSCLVENPLSSKMVEISAAWC